MNRTSIVGLKARRIWDSRARPTVEAEVTLQCGAIGRGVAPSGASRGRYEAVERRDGGRRFGGADVTGAIASINETISPALTGRDASDQQGIDAALIALDGTSDKAALGGNAIIAVSLACLHGAARAQGTSLWAYLGPADPVLLPLPQIQIFGGGAHAARRTDVQDFLVIPPNAPSFGEALGRAMDVYRQAGLLMQSKGRLRGTADEGGWWPEFASNTEALELLTRAIELAGFVPGNDVAIALDVAASELFVNGHYRLPLEGQQLDRDGLSELLLRWIDRFPIVSLEDPLAEDDFEGWRRLTSAIGDRVQIVGDDLLVTSSARIAHAAECGACNAALIKVNQAGTVSEARAALETAKAAGWGTIVSARSGETEDTTIAHLAVGWNAGQIKVGSCARSERVAKWNELLRLEEELGSRGRFAGATALGTGGRRR
jgi:enolase 1/2/3